MTKCSIKSSGPICTLWHCMERVLDSFRATSKLANYFTAQSETIFCWVPRKITSILHAIFQGDVCAIRQDLRKEWIHEWQKDEEEAKKRMCTVVPCPTNIWPYVRRITVRWYDILHNQIKLFFSQIHWRTACHCINSRGRSHIETHTDWN